MIIGCIGMKKNEDEGMKEDTISLPLTTNDRHP